MAIIGLIYLSGALVCFAVIFVCALVTIFKKDEDPTPLDLWYIIVMPVVGFLIACFFGLIWPICAYGYAMSWRKDKKPKWQPMPDGGT